MNCLVRFSSCFARDFVTLSGFVFCASNEFGSDPLKMPVLDTGSLADHVQANSTFTERLLHPTGFMPTTALTNTVLSFN